MFVFNANGEIFLLDISELVPYDLAQGYKQWPGKLEVQHFVVFLNEKGNKRTINLR